MILIKTIINFLLKYKCFQILFSRCLYIIIFIYNYKKIKKRKKNILVLSSYRFRDIDNLQLLDKFSLIIIPIRIQYFLFSKYGKFLAKNKEKFFKRNKLIAKELEIINDFFEYTMSFFIKKIKIKATISAAAYYIQDAIFFSFLKKNNKKIIIVQRENYGPQQYQSKMIKKKLLDYEPTSADLILTQNLSTKKLFKKMTFYKNVKISVTGVLRMDNFIKKLKTQKKKTSPNKSIVFFSFTKNSGIDNQNNNTSISANTTKGLSKFFKNSHNLIIKYAMKNPNLNLIIKHKFGGHFLQEIENNWKKYSGKPLPRNCKLTNTEDPHELILKADLVVAFNSTTIFEAGLKDIPIIIPFFDEASKKYIKYFNLSELKNAYTIVDKNEFVQVIDRSIKHFKLNNKIKTKRLAFFEKYVSSTKGGASNKVSKEISHIT